ncbi:MAG: acyl-CoA dehydratase activase-related protein [Firmicutes bacterium]|nr:acyl-CoA dehydratase activase-related protein [Bacillota bacterium]
MNFAQNFIRVGLDVGSTTVKAAVIDNRGGIIYTAYARHYSKITEKVCDILSEISGKFGVSLPLAFSGSAGMGIAQRIGIPFIQEVFATKVALKDANADVAIELGGEDAKILFLSGGLEVRMNGTCAGGTGSFIDQMASLLGVTADEMNSLAKEAKKIYPIASRCGVFAKTDIQPLLNQGADKSDLSRSILRAIVNQTLGGLAQGRAIEGSVVYLGGPLTFFTELQKCFDEALRLKGVCPKHSLFFVAKGAALLSDKTFGLPDLISNIQKTGKTNFNTLRPLFNSSADYDEFKKRHDIKTPYADIADYEKNGKKAYIGIDAGSTTIKMAVIGEDGELLLSHYQSNKGGAIEIVRGYLAEIYCKYPLLNLVSGASTGYGEDLIKNAFLLPVSVVETAAHFTAAKKLMPDVDFVIDIGGQDMKCFKIKNGAVDDIFLNEACSSGCGSFLQVFAEGLGCGIEEFANLAVAAQNPVDLGSRCTVFMNSAVKQAQKDGASLSDISAGLAVSVVKNALYKVIRVRDKRELGKNIVVQGGTFLSDAVLRAFEQETDVGVIRPDIAGVMGAYGAALYALSAPDTGIIGKDELAEFSYQTKAAACGLCLNNCSLTVNLFSGGRRFISGNRCERPVTGKLQDESLNIFDYKLSELSKYMQKAGNLHLSPQRSKIGLPMVLNFFELLPFWHTFFDCLGFDVITTPFSDGNTFKEGQSAVPSDTVCYPAKLVHGHIRRLINLGADNIFYPCMSYNLDEKISNNHYNCPVVAYYPEVLNLEQNRLIRCFIDLNDKKAFAKKIHAVLSKRFDLPRREVNLAVKNAYGEYAAYMRKLKQKGAEIIAAAAAQNKDVIVLCGRPYHADPEVNHGIPQLITAMGKAVISEDCLPPLVTGTSVLNQWTYHARMYSAAKYVAAHPNIHLVQLVSFGCGLDAVTADEVRRQVEEGGRLYTQLKIDEITNLGAVKIRLKSLFAALEDE